MKKADDPLTELRPLVGQGGPSIQRNYRWWFKGVTREGNTVKFEGTGRAVDDQEAMKNIDTMMREQHPTVRWMHGRKVEGDGVRYGPTVQMLKRTRVKS